MIDKQRLEAKCSTWNITLTGTQLDQLDAFAQILVDYNQKVNLTAITDPEGIEDKHFLDSLLFSSSLFLSIIVCSFSFQVFRVFGRVIPRRALRRSAHGGLSF